MYAHATLWVDAAGRLCEEAPSRGLKIAAVKGDEIPRDLVRRYGLTESEGKIVQEKQAHAENKAVKDPPDKAVRGGLSITKRGVRSAKKKKADPEPEPDPEVETEEGAD